MPLTSQLLEGWNSTSIEALASHVQRSPGPLRRYAQALLGAADTAPSDVMERHARHAATLLKGLREGKPNQHIVASTLLHRLEEDLSTIPEADHESFVKALERDFDIEVHHFDEVGPSVYVWVSAEDNDSLHDQLATSVDLFDKVLDKRGYVCLRRGNNGDRSYGHAFEDLTQWVFTYSPMEEAPDRKGDLDTRKTLKMLKAMAASAVEEAGGAVYQDP